MPYSSQRNVLMITNRDDANVLSDAQVQHGPTVNRREVLAAGAGAGTALAMGGLLGPSPARAARPHLSNNAYTINFFAQNYTPAKPTTANPHPYTELAALAKTYHTLHPNITINFLPQSVATSFGTG